MPGIGAMQINFTSDVGGLLKGIAESTKALGAIDRAGQKVAENTARMTAGMGKAWTAVKVAMAAVVANVTIHQLNEAAETVDKLGKASARLGIGVEALSALRFAAKEADVDFENLSKILCKAAKTIGELSITQDKLLVGSVMVRLRDASGHVRSIADMLPELAQGLESVGSQAEQLNLASKLFGKEGGGQFVQLLKESGGFIANIGTQTERARRLGVLFTDDQVEKLTAYNDAVGRISEAWLGLRVNLITKVAPILTTMANGLASAIASIPDIMAKLVDVMKGMWSDPALRAQFVDFTDALGNIWFTWTVNMQAVVVTAISELFGRILPNVAIPLAKSFSTQLAAAMMVELGNALFSFNKTMGFNSFITKWIDGIAAGLKSVGDSQKLADSGAEIREKIWEELSGPTWTAAAASDLMTSMEDAISKAASKGEALFGIKEILARHSMDIAATIKANPIDLGEMFELDVGPIDRELTDLQLRLKNFALAGKEMIGGFSQGWSDAMTEMLWEGKNTFNDLLRSWGKMLTSMALQKLATDAIFQGLGEGFAGLFTQRFTANSGTSTFSPFVFQSPTPNAKGNAFSGGIVTKPTIFPMARGMGLMGEAGPEAVMPLDRMPGGKLGVRASGGGTVVQVIDQRSGGSPVEVRESTGSDGRKMVQAIVRDQVAKMATDGSLDRVLGPAYGARRSPTRR